MESLINNEPAPASTPTPKPGFFADPKKAKGIFITFLILTIVFFLAAAALGYLYFKKNKDLKKSNQENQVVIDQLKKDKTDLEKQVADAKKETEDLKNSSKQSSETAANKQTIIKAYTEILTYFAQVVENHNGFDGWTDAEYQHAREIAKATQSPEFLATVDWAWNQKTVSVMERVVRFLKEISVGINDNLL